MKPNNSEQKGAFQNRDGSPIAASSLRMTASHIASAYDLMGYDELPPEIQEEQRRAVEPLIEAAKRLEEADPQWMRAHFIAQTLHPVGTNPWELEEMAGQKPTDATTHGRPFTPSGKVVMDHLIATTLHATFSDEDEKRMLAATMEPPKK